MIYTLYELMHWSVDRKRLDGQWVPSRPMEGPRILRWIAAWAVLRGRADAFTWPSETP